MGCTVGRRNFGRKRCRNITRLPVKVQTTAECILDACEGVESSQGRSKRKSNKGSFRSERSKKKTKYVERHMKRSQRRGGGFSRCSGRAKSDTAFDPAPDSQYRAVSPSGDSKEKKRTLTNMRCGATARINRLKATLMFALTYIAMTAPKVVAGRSSTDVDWWRSSVDTQSSPELLISLVVLLVLLLVLLVTMILRRGDRVRGQPNRQYADYLDPNMVRPADLRMGIGTASHRARRKAELDQAYLDGLDETRRETLRERVRKNHDELAAAKKEALANKLLEEDTKRAKNINGDNTATRDVQRFYYAMRDESDMEACMVRVP